MSIHFFGSAGSGVMKLLAKLYQRRRQHICQISDKLLRGYSKEISQYKNLQKIVLVINSDDFRSVSYAIHTLREMDIHVDHATLQISLLIVASKTNDPRTMKKISDMATTAGCDVFAYTKFDDVTLANFEQQILLLRGVIRQNGFLANESLVSTEGNDNGDNSEDDAERRKCCLCWFSRVSRV